MLEVPLMKRLEVTLLVGHMGSLKVMHLQDLRRTESDKVIGISGCILQWIEGM